MSRILFLFAVTYRSRTW